MCILALYAYRLFIYVRLFVLLYYRRPSGTDKEFFVQLFVEPDKSMTMPSTELLLIKMFKEQKITFAKVYFIAG